MPISDEIFDELSAVGSDTRVLKGSSLHSPGLEFCGGDLTDRERRLQYYFHDDETIEVVFVEGAKSIDPGSPTEVFVMTKNQVISLMNTLLNGPNFRFNTTNTG